jgi:c-di-GMP-binding flagellar brake protein YcgR
MEIVEEETKARYATVNFERRRHIRFSIDMPVEYWLANNSNSRPGRTEDISEGGLLLYVHDKMELGQILKVRVFINRGLEISHIEAIVEVVWKDLNFGDKGDDYRMGVKLVDISKADIDKLTKFLNTLIIKKTPSEVNLPPRLLSALGISIIKKEGQ